MSILDQIAFDQIADERDKAQQEIKPLKQHIKQLKEELMDAKNKYAAMVSDVALYEDRADRIKRLEDSIEKLKDAGDLVFIWLLYNRSHIGGLDVDSALREWKQSKKEAKP